jgi:hypothetical protein
LFAIDSEGTAGLKPMRRPVWQELLPMTGSRASVGPVVGLLTLWIYQVHDLVQLFLNNWSG